MASRTRAIDVRNNLVEMALAPLAPFLLMTFGAVAIMATGWLLRWWTDFGQRPTLVAVMSSLLGLSCVSLSLVGWLAFKPLVRGAGPHWWLNGHVALTVVSAHVSICLTMWFGSREFVWATWAIGSLIAIVSWGIRRLARATLAQHGTDDGDAIGLAGSNFLD